MTGEGESVLSRFWTRRVRKTRHECVKVLTERSEKRGIASESVQSGESDTAGEMDVQGGLPLSPCLSVRLSPSLSSGGWHFPSSVWPLTEGGMNRGVERGERAGWAEKKRGAKGGWAADGHLNARPPIYWKSGGGRHKQRVDTHINMDANSFATATHFLLVFRGVGTRNRFKTFAFVRPPQALIEMLVREASRWPSSLRDAPCNHATLTSRVQIWPRTLTVPHPPISPSLCFLCCFPQS